MEEDKEVQRRTLENRCHNARVRFDKAVVVHDQLHAEALELEQKLELQREKIKDAYGRMGHRKELWLAAEKEWKACAKKLLDADAAMDEVVPAAPIQDRAAPVFGDLVGKLYGIFTANQPVPSQGSASSGATNSDVSGDEVQRAISTALHEALAIPAIQQVATEAAVAAAAQPLPNLPVQSEVTAWDIELDDADSLDGIDLPEKCIQDRDDLGTDAEMDEASRMPAESPQDRAKRVAEAKEARKARQAANMEARTDSKPVGTLKGHLKSKGTTKASAAASADADPDPASL